jgi:hypothetical protein
MFHVACDYTNIVYQAGQLEWKAWVLPSSSFAHSLLNVCLFQNLYPDDSDYFHLYSSGRCALILACTWIKKWILFTMTAFIRTSQLITA